MATTTPTAPTPVNGRQDAPHLRRRHLGIALVVAAVIAAALVVAWPAPRALQYGDRVGTTATVGQVTVVGMGSASRSIDVRHAAAVVAAGSAPAVIDVLVCHTESHREVLGTARDWASLGEYCSKISPADGAHLAGDSRQAPLDSGLDYFVMTVVPLNRGRIVVDGVRVTHSGRWRDQTERTGAVVTVNAS